jgi:hypothetical protein
MLPVSSLPRIAPLMALRLRFGLAVQQLVTYCNFLLNIPCMTEPKQSLFDIVAGMEENLAWLAVWPQPAKS